MNFLFLVPFYPSNKERRKKITAWRGEKKVHKFNSVGGLRVVAVD
jgi:hypothetical protein